MRRVGLSSFLMLVLSACTASNGGGDAGPSDMGPACDGGAVALGCPCSTPGAVVCGNPDYLCATGIWILVADACGELDAGARDSGADALVACALERQLDCLGGHGQVCCGGRVRSFVDGPCGPRTEIDGGPCDGDAGLGCILGQEVTCAGGAWASTGYVCDGVCATFGP